MSKKSKKMIYGNAIEYYRKRKGWTIRHLATKLGHRSYNSVARWERGEFMPDVINMEKLCTALDVTFEQLFPPPLHNSELKMKHKDEMITMLKTSLQDANNKITELEERLYPTNYEVSDKTSNEFTDEFEIDIE
jgi:transcriptional regulator with XRE-family HTH domain